MASSSGSRRPAIVNPVVTYGYIRLESMSPEEVCSFLLETFDSWEIGKAKTTLWDYSEEVGGNYEVVVGKRRKRIDSTNRSAVEADCTDLVEALQALRQTLTGTPDFAISVWDLMDLPPVKPVIVHHPRQTTIESKVADMQEELRLSKESFQKTVTSVQDALAKMSEGMALFRQQHAEDSSAQACPPLGRVPAASASDSGPSSAEGRSRKSKPPAELTDSRIRAAETLAAPSDGKRPLDGFTLVTRRRPRRQKVIKGVAASTDNSAFRGAPEVRSIFVANVSKTTKEEDVAQFLQQHDVHTVKVRVLSHPDSCLKSFKVTVLKDKVTELLQDKFPWPQDVKVRRFVPSRS